MARKQNKEARNQAIEKYYLFKSFLELQQGKQFRV
jgi:hypothetical protein